MKLIKIAAASLLLASSVYATETLSANMSQMENGLNNIQKGFLYNQMSMIKNGVGEIKKANKLFHDKKATEVYLPKNKHHMTNIAFNAAKRINDSTDELLMYVDAKQMSKAQHAYSDIINACGACHSVVRGW